MLDDLVVQQVIFFFNILQHFYTQSSKGATINTARVHKVNIAHKIIGHLIKLLMWC